MLEDVDTDHRVERNIIVGEIFSNADIIANIKAGLLANVFVP